jgi:PIN domain nuclease of toxin-antitoxin system
VRLLLDTHIWIWGLTEPDRLVPRVRAALNEPNRELWLSSVSVWEFLVLLRKGRLAIEGMDGPRWIAEALRRAPVREAPITHAVAIESERLRLNHWDPADRFIAASARLLDATLVTADERLIQAAEVKTLANK